MFSGIIEAQTQIIKVQSDADGSQKVIRIFVQRPPHFDDLKNGDSICVNGICLTIERFNDVEIQFCLGAETLALLGDHFNQWQASKLNLERSLKFGDRVHGHLVTGHVDSLGKIIKAYQDGECWQIVFQVSEEVKKAFWKKGSVCLNGVSLTVNDVQDNLISVCLIPETIQATNLAQYRVGAFLNVEADYLAKAYFQFKVNN
jgi:riboflavin synthase